MAHLNLYLPNELAAALKEEAAGAEVPLSRYVLSLLGSGKSGDAWPPEYFTRVCGFLTGEMAEPADSLPEPVELADSRR